MGYIEKKGVGHERIPPYPHLENKKPFSKFRISKKSISRQDIFSHRLTERHEKTTIFTVVVWYVIIELNSLKRSIL